MSRSLNTEKNILVTGASSGIGKDCCLTLAQKGFRVFATVRKPADGDALKTEQIHPLFLDVTDSDSIQQVLTTISGLLDGNGLDGIVNNAGIVVAGPLECLPISALRNQLEVNVLGQIAVTQAFLPLIRKTTGRVVFISSISGRAASPFVGPYAASKHALEALADALRIELAPWNIRVSLIEPGCIQTPIWKKSQQSTLALTESFSDGWLNLYEAPMKKLANYSKQCEQRALPVQKVTEAIHHALTAYTPKTRYVIGHDARLRLLLKLLPDTWQDWIIRWKLDV